MAWHYAVGTKQMGPVTDEAFHQLVKAGQVSRRTLVWREGMPEWASAESVPELAGALSAAPPILPGTIERPTEEGVALGGLIPYKNGPALAGYYCSVASLIPGFGMVIGPVAVGLGIAGWKKASQYPRIGGKAHSIVAMALGGLVTVGHIAAIVIIVVMR